MAKIKECWLAVFLASLTSGCAQMDHLLPNSLLSGTPEVPRASRPREVTYPLETSQPISPEHKQPETLVQFALGLAEKGEAAKAAAFFLEPCMLQHFLQHREQFFSQIIQPHRNSQYLKMDDPFFF